MANWWDTCKNGGCIGYNPSPNCQGYGVSGYRSDYSVPLPYGTPVQSPVNGLVLPDHTSGGGFYSAYGGQGDTGGEVDIATVSPFYHNGARAPAKIVNVGIIHLDSASVTPGQWVHQGDIIGTSGGQTSGGQWPVSPQFSSGPHIGLQIHELGSWCKQLDPGILMGHLTAGDATSFFPTDDQLTANGLTNIAKTTSPQSATSVGATAGNCAPWDIGCLLGQLKANFGTLYLFGTQPWRIIKLVFGGALVLLGLVIAFLPDVGAAVVTGAGIPEAAPLVQQALGRSRGPSGFARSAIRTAGVVQGKKTLAKREAAGVKKQQLEEHKKRSAAAKKGGETRRLNKSRGVSRMVVTKGERESLVKGREERYQRSQLERQVEEKRQQGQGQGKKFINPGVPQVGGEEKPPSTRKSPDELFYGGNQEGIT